MCLVKQRRRDFLVMSLRSMKAINNARTYGSSVPLLQALRFLGMSGELKGEKRGQKVKALEL